MRDTLLGILFIGGIIGGYLYLRETNALVSPGMSQRTALQKQQKSETGVRHAKSANNHEHQQSKNHEQDAGASVDLAEAESLPTIYKEQDTKPAAPAVKKFATEVPERRPPRKSKFLHGVPVEAWILSKQNAVSMPTEEGPSEIGMRVFVQCLELKKKGSQYVGEEECRQLLARR